jgi:hypothetical protein
MSGKHIPWSMENPLRTGRCGNPRLGISTQRIPAPVRRFCARLSPPAPPILPALPAPLAPLTPPVPPVPLALPIPLAPPRVPPLISVNSETLYLYLPIPISMPRNIYTRLNRHNAAMNTRFQLVLFCWLLRVYPGNATTVCSPAYFYRWIGPGYVECVACPPSGFYSDGNAWNACYPCYGNCPSDQYMSSPCSLTHNRVCLPCSCAADSYQSNDCGGSTAPVCLPCCSTCSSSQYESRGCNQGRMDRECTNCTLCDNDSTVSLPKPPI